MIRIGKAYTFEAAHHLPFHDGKCRNLHGHSYVVTVTLQGEIQKTGPKQGMVFDYADLDTCMAYILDLLDHRDLNRDVSGMDENPTAENIAQWIFDELGITMAAYDEETAKYDDFPSLHSVRVQETGKTFAEVIADA